MKTTFNITVSFIIGGMWGIIAVLAWHPYAGIVTALVTYCVAFAVLNRATRSAA